MTEQKNNKRGIFYGILGVSTLVVAIIGATFAYFTASAQGGNNITGNMATMGFNLSVDKVVDPGVTSGMIPMSNTMVQAAVQSRDGSTAQPCVDANGNAVCQIYKVTVTNASTATLFVDGYVTLAGGSGVPTDYTSGTNNPTTMRWAQVFPDTTNTGNYTTAGTQTLGLGATESKTYNAIGGTSATTPATYDATSATNTTDIKTAAGDITDTLTISGSSYQVIKTNYIRVSNHSVTTGTSPSEATIDPTYTRTADLTSALVYSQQLQPNDNTDNSGPDQAEYYFVVWLSETGHNQNPGASVTTPSSTTNPAAAKFFKGLVAFVSAQGSEVTATFSGYASVQSDQA